MSRKRKKSFGVRQDYNRKKLQNPFFKDKKGRVRSGWLKYMVLAVLLAIIFLIWFFLASPTWQIKEIKIEGLTRFSNSEIEDCVNQQKLQSRLGIFKQNNIFLLQKDYVLEELLNKYNFSSLEIRKKLPHTLEIIIQERPYAFIFQQGENYYYSSADGYALKEIVVSDEDKSKYFVLENTNDNDLINQSDKINIKENYLNFVISLHQELIAQPDFLIDRFIIDQEFNTIKADFTDGPVVFFNTRSDVSEQVKRLALVKSEKIKDNFSRVEYIDLRYGDRIFLYPPIN